MYNEDLDFNATTAQHTYISIGYLQIQCDKLRIHNSSHHFQESYSTLILITRTGQILFDQPNPTSPLYPLTVGWVNSGQTGFTGQLIRFTLVTCGRIRLDKINP
jgi:hypothetical protein